MTQRTRAFRTQAAVMACALSVAVGSWAGCAPREYKVTGQVFIVTQGSENVKLGLVAVQLLSDAAMRRHVVAKQEKAAAQKLTLQPGLDSAAKCLSEAQGEVEAARRAYSAAMALVAEGERAAEERSREERSELLRVENELLQTQLRYPSSLKALEAELAASQEREKILKVRQWAYQRRIEQLTVLEATVRSARNRVASAEKRYNNQMDISSAIQQRYDFWDSGAYYFEGLPSPIAVATTDANGEFELRVPRGEGKFVLAAHSGRQALDKTEDYTWIIQLPDDARKGTKVLLSNETLTIAASPLSLVTTKK